MLKSNNFQPLQIQTFNQPRDPQYRNARFHNSNFFIIIINLKNNSKLYIP